MGLDLYLYKEHYVGGEHRKDTISGGVDIQFNDGDGTRFFKLPASRISTIRELVLSTRYKPLFDWLDSRGLSYDGTDTFYITLPFLVELKEELDATKRGEPISQVFPKYEDEYDKGCIDELIELLDGLIKEECEEIVVEITY